MSSLLASRRYVLALGIVIAYAVINFILNILVVGGSDFIYRLNTVFPILWGLLAVLLLVGLLKRERGNEVSRRVYGWLLWGVGFWALGDLIWGLYDFAFHIEVPYPSWADLAWLGGYPFLFCGLYVRIRSYGVPLQKRDRWLMGAILAALLVVVVGFVLPPIVRDYDPQLLGESILNILYPVLDTITLILTLAVFFTLERGRFALPWAVITFAFVCNSVADLLFYRALWVGTYYPDGRATLFSVLIDAIYNLLYPSLCLGFYMASDLVSGRAEISDQLAARRAPDLQSVSFAVFTDSENRIISISENLVNLLKARDKSRIVGGFFDAVLGIGQDEMKSIRRSLEEQGYVRERPLSVADSTGGRSQVLLTGFPARDSRGGYTGANFVLQSKDNATFSAPPLTQESLLLVNSILREAGVLEKEKREARVRALRSRFQGQVELLYELISSEGNRRIARTMEAACEQLARDRGWPIQFSDGKTAMPAECDPGMLEEAAPLLLAAAREHAVRVLGEDLVRTELEKLAGGAEGE